MWVDSENGLWVFLPIMIALAVVGVVLASQDPASVYHYTGIALSIVSVIWIFAGLKHYYDIKDYGAPSKHSS
jgi:uncharacterized membrane protein YfcA